MAFKVFIYLKDSSVKTKDFIAESVSLAENNNKLLVVVPHEPDEPVRVFNMDSVIYWTSQPIEDTNG